MRNEKLRSNSVSYHNVTNDLRRKRSGRGSVSYGINEIATEQPISYFGRIRRQIVNHIRNWITASIGVEKAKLRGFKAYIEPQIWAIAGAPAATVVPYNQVKIQGNMYNTKTYQYRIGEPGLYSFTALLYHKANTGDNIPQSVISIYKNGIVEDTIGGRYSNSYTQFWSGTTNILCACGDLIDVRIRLSNVSGVQTAVNDSLYGYFTGNYEGNNCFDTGYIPTDFTF